MVLGPHRPLGLLLVVRSWQGRERWKVHRMSIFEEAGKRPKKKEEPTPKKSEAPLLGDEELQARYQDLMKKFGELSEKVGKIFDALGKRSDEIRKLLDNPDNFTEAQWKSLQERRRALSQQLFKERAAAFEKQLAEKELATSAARRKKKTVGYRRGGWLPMK